ncbi:MAG: RNA methyltransferase [Alphaproteobacteria bacterium]|nr:RNA methyltransferase [Alphaproteobacteria bacterium]
MKAFHAGGLILAFLALATASHASMERQEAMRVLDDIQARRGPSELKQITPDPRRTTIAYRVGDRESAADLYEPDQPIGAGLVLVPGFTPHGKDDARVVDLANSLARARFLVLVPDLLGTRALRMRHADARGIADAAIHLAGMEATSGQDGVGVFAISYAVGLAVLATLQPDAQNKIRFVVSLGGYYDARAVVTFITTGAYRQPSSDQQEWKRPLPAAKWIFLASNIDTLSDPEDRATLAAMADRRLLRRGIEDLAARLGPEGWSLYALLMNTDPDLVQAWIDRLPPAARQQLESLSPRNFDLSHLSGRLILIHGREDRMIPYTESLALEAAVENTELFIIDGFSHIDPSKVGPDGRQSLIDAVQAVLRRRK